MADKSKAKLATAKPVSTKWLKTAMRSIGVSANNVLKTNFAPNLYSAVESGVNTSKTILSTVKRNTNGSNNLTSHLQNNKYVKFAQTAYKNALTDLKSGNLNNTERYSDSLLGGDSENVNFDSIFGDESGFSFGDDGADNSIDVNIVNASGNQDAMFAMTTQLQKQTEATLKTSQANMNAMIAVNSAAMMQSQQSASMIASGLDAINKNLTSLIEFNNSNMNKFIESSMAFYERMGTKFEKDGASQIAQPEKINASGVLNGFSGINMSQYKQYVKQQFKDTFSKTEIGMITGMLGEEELKMAASNPLGFASEALIKFMVPKVISNSIKGVEETFSSFMPSLLHKLSDWGESQATGALGHVKRFIGKTLGLKMDRKDKFDRGSRIERGPVPFDGVTKHAITEIITKELREQTSYLKSLAERFKVNTTDAKNNSEVFDYKTGKYVKASDVTTKILEELKDAVVGSMNSSEFGKNLRKYEYGITDDKMRSNVGRGFDELMIRLEKLGRIPKMNAETLADKESDYNKLISSLSTDKDTRDYIDNALKKLYTKNPNAVLNLSPALFTARKARNDAMADIEANPNLYNLYAAAGLDNIDIDDQIIKNISNSGTTSTKINSNQSNIFSRNKKKKNKSTSKNTIADIDNEQRKMSNDEILDSIDVSSEFYNYNGKGKVGQFLTKTTKGLSELALDIIHGSPKEAFAKFGKTMGVEFSDKFLTPLKTSLFGTKDDDNFSRDGMLSGVVNRFKDIGGILGHHITGKDYKDSTGKIHKLEDGQSSLFGSVKQIGSNIKRGVMSIMFGEEELDENGNPTGKRDKNASIFGSVKQFGKELKTNIMSSLFGTKKVDENGNIVDTGEPPTFTSVIKDGINGWVEAFRGPEDKERKGIKRSISERFQTYLFGEQIVDEDGKPTKKRSGGAVAKLQSYLFGEQEFDEEGNPTGKRKGGFLTHTRKMFSEFLVGDEKTGQRGILDMWNSAMKKTKKEGSEEGDGTMSTKAAGMGIVGAGAGALTGAIIGKMGILGATLSPLGPIGGAILGLGVSIAAQGTSLHKWLFGEKDENGNKTKEGVIGQVGNMIKASIVAPLKTGVQHIMEDAAFTVKTEILDRVRFVFDYALEPMVNSLKGFGDKIKQKFENIADKVNKAFTENVLEKIDDFLITPVRNVIGGITKVVWGVTKKAITAPFKLIYNATKLLTNKLIKGIGNVTTKILDIVSAPFKKLGAKLLSAVGGLLNTVIKKPMNFIGGVTNYLGDRVAGVGKDDKELKTVDGKIQDKKEMWKLNRENRKIERANMNKRWREDKIHNKNLQRIAKATGYQVTDDTEENRRRAEIAMGKKFDSEEERAEFWRVAATEDPSHKITKKGSTEGMDESKILGANLKDLSDEGKQTKTLLEILSFLKGNIKKDDEGSGDTDKPEEKSENKDDKKEEQSSINDKKAELTGSEKVQADINAAGGLRNYLGNKFNNTKLSNFTGIKFKPKTKKSTDDAKLEAELSEIEKNLGVDGFNIEKYADGTENAKPGVSVVGDSKDGKENPEVVIMGGGEQVYSNRKPFNSVITDIVGNARNAITDIIGKAKSSGSGRATIEKSAAQKAQEEAIKNGETAAESREQKAEEERNKHLAKIAENTGEQKEATKEHNFQWSSIFSKKGLLTAGLLLAAPLLIKAIPTVVDLVKKIWPVVESIGSSISSIFEKLGWTNKTGARGDGDTVGDKIAENTDRVTSLIDTKKSVKDRVKGFVLNEDGQVDHMTDANSKLLVSSGADLLYRLGGGKNRLKKQGISGAIDAVKNIGKITYNADDLVKAGLAKNTDEVVELFGKGPISADKIGKYLGSSSDEVFDVVHGGLKSAKKPGIFSKLGSKIGSTKAAGVVKTGATKLADGASSMIKTVITKITTWLDDVVKAVGKKMGKEIGEGVVSGLLKNVSDVVTKFFSKISAKISAIFTKEGAIAASNTAFGLGIAIKGTEITLNAINGASGAARLFQVDQDYVDGKMTTIATLIGAAQGTMVGSIVDVVNELFASVTGVDFISELATIIYNAWAGEEKAAVLKAGKEEFKLKYEEYQDDELKKQYETQAKAGLIDSKSLSYDQFKQEVQNGTRKAKYDSFVDYNDKQHKTLGAKIGGGIAKGFKSLGKGISTAWSNTFGKTDKYLEDENGNKYYDNKDGTYQIINASGQDLGYISKEALPANLTEKKEKKKGSIGKSFDKFKATFASKKGTVYYSTDGSFYDAEGVHYSADGSRIGGDITHEELLVMRNAGMVEEGEGTIKSVLKDKGILGVVKNLRKGNAEVLNKATTAVSKLGTSLVKSANNLWNKAIDFDSNLKKKSINFLLGKKTTAWRDPKDGSYYVSNGSTFDQYNSNGEKIASEIATDDIQPNIDNGTFTEDKNFKIDTKASVAIKSLATAKNELFKTVKDLGVKGYTTLKEGATTLWNNIRSDGLIGGIKNFFKKNTTSVWFDTDGGYYKRNGDVYDYYNANNDLITEGISATEVEEKARTGVLTIGEVQTDSAAKDAVNKIKSAVAGAWNTAKETVSSGWKNFTNWITGKGGSGINNISMETPGDGNNQTSRRGGRGGRGNVPYYSQNDATWAKDSYGSDGATMSDTGCGPTAMAMVASGLTGKKVTPTELAKLSEFSGTRDSTGTNEKFINLASSAYGLRSSQSYNPDATSLYNAAAKGPVILLGQNTQGVKNPYTTAGHYVVADGVDEQGNIRIKDPRGSSYSKTYPANALAGTTDTMWNFGGRGTDIFSTLTSLFSEFSSRALTGLTTGNWNSDYSEFLAGLKGESTGSSTSDDASVIPPTEITPGTEIKGSTIAEKIWTYYKNMGLSDATIAGIMGNMRAESGLEPKNLQNSYENSLGFSDDSYTKAVDDGSYANFVNDSAGYGLVQWTYHSLKKALLNYARGKKKSIGDLETQLEFLAHQLQTDYPSTWAKMTSSTTPEDVSTIMLKEFEKPAVLNTGTRSSYARQYYNMYANRQSTTSGYNASTAKANQNNKANVMYGMGGRGATIDSINNLGIGNRDYLAAATASNYINNNNNNGITKAINMIISLLEAITGNTASTSSKLDMLENLKKSSITNVGGNTTNYVTNNGGGTSTNHTTSSGGSGSGPSRNQKIAELIAHG